MNKKTIQKIIDGLIDQDLENAEFERAREACDIIEERIDRAREYMNKMDEIAESS